MTTSSPVTWAPRTMARSCSTRGLFVLGILALVTTAAAAPGRALLQADADKEEEDQFDPVFHLICSSETRHSFENSQSRRCFHLPCLASLPCQELCLCFLQVSSTSDPVFSPSLISSFTATLEMDTDATFAQTWTNGRLNTWSVSALCIGLFIV